MVAAFDNITPHLTLQDRIRIYLDEKASSTGTNYVPVTIADLARDLHEDRMPVYQALYRIKDNKEIEFDQDENPDNRNKIKGIVVRKLEPSNRTYRRAAERGKTTIARQVHDVSVDSTAADMPNIMAYLNQRLTVEKMKTAAEASGLDADSVIQFEPNPIAEESLLLLQRLVDVSNELKETKDQLRQQEFDLEAANRDIEYLKRQSKETTRRELVAIS